MRAAPVPEAYRTPEEFAERLGVAVGTIYRWCAEGRIAFLKLGDSGSTRQGRGRPGAVRIAESEIARFIGARTVGATAPPPEPASPKRVGEDMKRLAVGPRPVEMPDEEDA